MMCKNIEGFGKASIMLRMSITYFLLAKDIMK